MRVSIDKMGVYILVAHLIITLAIIVVYCYTLVTGQGDETLKTILTVIVGYWFGSMGVNAIKPPNAPVTVSETKVKIEEDKQ